MNNINFSFRFLFSGISEGLLGASFRAPARIDVEFNSIYSFSPHYSVNLRNCLTQCLMLDICKYVSFDSNNQLCTMAFDTGTIPTITAVQGVKSFTKL